MRHTFVSLLSSNGTALEDIADLVGHRGTTTTETVYRKVIVPELRRGARSWTGYSPDSRHPRRAKQGVNDQPETDTSCVTPA
jgi:hypothetical protein